MSDLFIFDIETTAQPEAELIARFSPKFEASKTLKDPDKIAADIAAKRQAWIDDSALHAERGKILCIGWNNGDGFGDEIIEGDEIEVLSGFLKVLRGIKNHTVCGFNIMSFDLPFLRKRCIINGIPFPFYRRENKWEPWTFKTYDPMLDWQSGDRRAPFIGLVNLAKALGIPAENDGVGACFGETYRTDRASALAHLTQDLLLTRKVCERLMA